MTVTEKLGRRLAQGAMNEVADSLGPPWWLGLLLPLGAFLISALGGNKEPETYHWEDDGVTYMFF